ncbi:MAG: adenylosuccinate lyase [Dehalococcoidia bacterium]|nr:adenylosuccinate lyase [Dehalococcoidia bacterium]
MIPRYSRPEMAAIWDDEARLQQWLRVEIAACQAWTEAGRIPREDMERIRRATVDPDRAAEYEKEMHHDVNSFLRAVADSLGDESRFVHMGLTSSDVVDTALALQLVAAAELLERDVEALIDVLVAKAREHKDTLTMGRSHGVHAEPTTFGLKLAIWVEEMRRNAHRLAEAKATVAVGQLSGPVGTHATVPPGVEEATMRRLGLGVDPVSNQVVQRDRHAQFVQTLALIAASLEKFATEIRHLQRTEVLEAEEPFAAGQTGSSSMPHKRNPEKCERVCGLARLLRGHSVTALENVALWHERDISHSSAERIILPDSCLVLDYILDLFRWIMDGLIVYPDRMRQNMEISHGLVFSQRVLLALIDTGMNRQAAYRIVQRNAMRSWQERVPFIDLLHGDDEVARLLQGSELDGLFDYSYYLAHVDELFARIGL